MSPHGQARLTALALAAEQPIMASLELTYSCNWRCVFCYNPRHHDLRRLSLDEWQEVLADLRSLGVLTVTLTGGEPLTHPEFFPIAESARALGLAVRVFTNASLIDHQTADRLAALLPVSIETSLHGSGPASHDAATGKSGSFLALMAGIDRLLARRLRVTVKSPLTSMNENEIDAMQSLVAGLGLPYTIDPSLTPRDDGDRTPLRWAPTEAGLRRLHGLPGATLANKPRSRVEGEPNCGLGRITMAIDPEGNVFPCIQWRHTSLGNVRDRRLRDLWRGSPERRTAADAAVKATSALLKTGGPVSQGSFCPAIAFQFSGDPLLVDSSTDLRARVAAESRTRQGD